MLCISALTHPVLGLAVMRMIIDPKPPVDVQKIVRARARPAAARYSESQNHPDKANRVFPLRAKARLAGFLRRVGYLRWGGKIV